MSTDRSDLARMHTSCVCAPGKAMIVGEYAVLDGSPAVVAAIDCFAEATLRPGMVPNASPFLVAAQIQTRQALQARGIDPAMARIDWLPQVDTSSFSRDGRKLGLGSSAAATVAAVGSWYVAAGLDVDSDAVRHEIAAVARDAHDAAQGIRGSGSDILAAAWGGVRVVGAASISAMPEHLHLPDGLRLCLIATTESASTAQLVARYRQAGDATQPARALLSQAAVEFISACRDDQAELALQSIHQALQGYVQLGSVISCALATEEHRTIADVVRSLGGAAKPSGAGGGDLAVALVPDDTATQRLIQRLPSHLSVLPLTVSERGLHASFNPRMA